MRESIYIAEQLLPGNDMDALPGEDAAGVEEHDIALDRVRISQREAPIRSLEGSVARSAGGAVHMRHGDRHTAKRKQRRSAEWSHRILRGRAALDHLARG